MPVPGSMQDLAQQANANFPTGSELIGTNLDDYLRAHAAILRRTYSLASVPVAAGSTTDVTNADGESVEITGTATINSLGTGFVGCYRELRFAAACTLVHSNNLVLPFGNPITTRGGDKLVFRCTATGRWELVSNSNSIDYATLNSAIEAAMGSGGNMTIIPRLYSFEADADQTDFLLEGAGVDTPLLYDVYVESTASSRLFFAQEPYVDFTITQGDGEDRYCRLTVAPGDSYNVFVVLRGYSRPWQNPNVIDSLNIPIFTVADSTFVAGSQYRWGLVRCSSMDPVAVTIPENSGGEDDWGSGGYLSFKQVTAATVEIVAALGVTLQVPEGFVAKTRALNSIITATCEDADLGLWTLSGDLLRGTAPPDMHCIQIPDRSMLNTTNITTGAGKGAFIMPYGMQLKPILSGGCYASLSTAQAAGTLLAVDVKRNGTSIFTTALTFDNGKKTTRPAATPAVYAVGGDVIYEGDEITVDVTAVGTALAKGLTVYLVGQRT